VVFETTASIREAEASHSAQCYDSFKSHLIGKGFLVYPTEFDCAYSEHPFVDIAAKMGSYYWAFEYKSQADSVSRGLEQLRCYLRWFDYVVLVSERTFDHRTSENYWSLKNLGAGIWFYDPAQDKCIKRCNPDIQRPSLQNRIIVARRFSALYRKEHRPSQKDDLSRQLDLFAFVS
jgi:hypothetical protein